MTAGEMTTEELHVYAGAGGPGIYLPPPRSSGGYKIAYNKAVEKASKAVEEFRKTKEKLQWLQKAERYFFRVK